MQSSYKARSLARPTYPCRVRRVIALGGLARRVIRPTGEPDRLPVTFAVQRAVRIPIRPGRARRKPGRSFTQKFRRLPFTLNPSNP